jgi:hypothetical protein
LRGTGVEHHVLTLREAPQAQLIAVYIAARDRAAVDALAQRAAGFGADVKDLREISDVLQFVGPPMVLVDITPQAREWCRAPLHQQRP